MHTKHGCALHMAKTVDVEVTVRDESGKSLVLVEYVVMASIETV